MTRSHLLCLITSALLTAGCGGGKGDAQKKAGTPAAPPKPKVAVATTTMLADLVRKVAGDGFEVVGLMGPGVDPHLYKNTTGDLNSMQRAKVTFYNGFHLEGRMEEVFDAMRGRGKSMVAVGEAVPKDDRIVPKDGAGHPDPHVWGDVRNWILAIEPVVQGLSAEGRFRRASRPGHPRPVPLGTLRRARLASGGSVRKNPFPRQPAGPPHAAGFLPG